MCAGAIVLARIPTVVFGVADPKRGGGSVFSIFTHPGLNHRPEVVAGVLADECRSMLTAFFQACRDGKNPKPPEPEGAQATCRRRRKP